MKDVNYVIGRLQGLNELVKILKDLVSKKGVQNSEIVATITDHISNQLDSILDEFDALPIEPEKKDALMQLKEKHSRPPADESDEGEPEEGSTQGQEGEEKEEAPEEKLDKHEKTVDELLKDLESLKSQ